MATPIAPIKKWEEESKDKRPVTFIESLTDFGRIIVYCFRRNGVKEILGYLNTKFDGEETKYFSTNRNGREIFPPSTDFHEVEARFEKYARLHDHKNSEIENDKIINSINYPSIKNLNPMQTTSQNPEQKTKKINQFIFMEYEKATKEGHFITIVDAYHNVIGRINKSYNPETKKYEYTSFDHAGKPMSQNEKLWELKNEFINNREQLLEQAHQRRLESKGQVKETPQPIAQPNKVEDRKKEVGKVRDGKQKTKDKAQTKSEQKATEKNNERTAEKKSIDEIDMPNREEKREEELNDVRNDIDDGRGEMDMER